MYAGRSRKSRSRKAGCGITLADGRTTNTGLPIKGVEIPEGWRTSCVCVCMCEAGSAATYMYTTECDRHLGVSFQVLIYSKML